jgi:protein SCO1/2
MPPRILLTLVLAAACWAAPAAWASPDVSGSAGTSARAAVRPTASPAEQAFADVVLVDQHGKRHRLYPDLLQGKVVVVNTFYTSCTNGCDVVMRLLAGVREVRDVLFLSITSHPREDTPARLRDYADRLGARPGWYLLTGDTETVWRVLTKIGHGSGPQDAQYSVLVVGNEPRGVWKKMLAIASPGKVARIVKAVAHAAQP